MKDTLRPRIAMLHATLGHFDEHPEAWAGKAPIVRNVAAVRDGLGEIERAARAQAAGATEGLTTDKRAAREAAVLLLAALSDKAEGYAIESGDADFEAAVGYSPTAWRRMAEADFFARADTALARIDAALGALGEYEVTRREIAATRDALDAARPLTAARDNVRADRTVATEDLGGSYSVVVAPLAVLDLLVPRLVEDRAFVAEYRHVREIVGD